MTEDKQKSRRKVLWISPYAPYDEVVHAGGKIHNYYVKSFHKSGLFDITVLSICLQQEEKKLDLGQYGIKNKIYVMDRNAVQKFRRRAVSALSYVNPFDYYAGGCLDFERRRMLAMLKRYMQEGNEPEIVILQWTFAVLLWKHIRAICPNAKIVAIEEDVTFLGYERKREYASGIYQKWFWSVRSAHMKSLELKALENADLVVTNNFKDTELLKQNQIREDKIFTSMPYLKLGKRCIRKPGRDILFLGVMSRQENSGCVKWFIEKVMPLLKEKALRFIVIGGETPDWLKDYQSERVVIKGFVPKLDEYYAESLCFVAPLQLGAGVKVKILEAMSQGVPVLTNDIGIEGIPAERGEEYLHCETPEEYADAIKMLYDSKDAVLRIGENGLTFIDKSYDLQAKTEGLIKRIISL